ncbi:replication initiator protein A [Prosthecobacter sp.]|uniref:replication initiator protein A n=1 Tax=Prosthecobacter sp. TaxID=1965333 RepID=UPI003783686E
MGRMIEGGIKEHQDLARFAASTADITPKDQIDLMARNWFSLTPGRTKPIEHEYVDSKTGQTETVRITGSSEHGIATIYDQDLLIFAISQWIDAKRLGMEPSRRIHFTPYQFFAWLNIAPHGTAYNRLKDALHRLKMTSIQTTIRSDSSKRKRNRIRQFSWISEWEITEEQGEVRGIEVVLAEWLFESIQGFHVLTLDKKYFEIPGGVERWLYLYARKATGGPNGVWKETFKSLYQKSASQQEYKHYASTLRKLVQKNDLPGFRLEKVSSTQGKDMLLMERTEKRAAIEAKEMPVQEKQLVLIERSPLEEAWENVLEIMRKQIGTDQVKAWLEKLQLGELVDGTLTYRTNLKFVADWVENNFKHKLESAWHSMGHPVNSVRIETKGRKSAA